MDHPPTDGTTLLLLPLLLLLLLLLLAAAARLVRSPLRGIPGSVLYKLTPLTSQLRAAWGLLADDCEADYYAYGDIYAVGPGVVVVSNPDDCRRVLGSGRFVKSEFYQAFAL
ncbi:hypothetical protein IWQ57_006066, partial [Coemansia nantahalensis]